jgi:uncharacterized protein (DUF1697 family)
MPRYLALLRGINVGGRNKVAMADLRELAGALGLADAATYIQSGNLLFSCPEAETGKLADMLEREIAARLGARPAVVVLSGPELRQVIAANPFPDEANLKCLHAMFWRDEASADVVAAVAAAVTRVRQAGSRDDAVVVGRTLFLHTPDGYGRSELAAQLSRAAVQPAGTARNWATVTTLLGLLAADR